MQEPGSGSVGHARPPSVRHLRTVTRPGRGGFSGSDGSRRRIAPGAGRRSFAPVARPWPPTFSAMADDTAWGLGVGHHCNVFRRSDVRDRRRVQFGWSTVGFDGGRSSVQTGIPHVFRSTRRDGPVAPMKVGVMGCVVNRRIGAHESSGSAGRRGRQCGVRPSGGLRRAARSEIVDRKSHAQLFQRIEAIQDLLRLVDHRALGQFEDKLRPRQSRGVQRMFHIAHEVIVAQRSAGDIDSDGETDR